MMRDRDSLEGGLMMNKLPHTLPPVMILMTGTPWKRGIKFNLKTCFLLFNFSETPTRQRVAVF